MLVQSSAVEIPKVDAARRCDVLVFVARHAHRPVGRSITVLHEQEQRVYVTWHQKASKRAINLETVAGKNNICKTQGKLS